jgi:ubiquitin C-terminal hydrolase
MAAALGSLRWQRYLQQNASMTTNLFCGQTVRGSQCCNCRRLMCLHEEQRYDSTL